jgi:HEAT repeat protein
MTMQESRRTPDTDSFQALIAMLFTGSVARKLRAAEILAETGVPGIGELLDASGDADRMMRRRALMALGALFQPKSAFLYPGASRTGNPDSPFTIPLCANGQKSIIVCLLIEKMHHDADEECRIMAAASLIKIGEHSGVKEVQKECQQQGRNFEGEVLDVVWGTSDAPANGMPDTLQSPLSRSWRERQGEG